ncbi:hypothetical protein N7499_003739 [Penicillium canescens]|nr:hypothetical protein N7499_003739 [Penicillium canescens]
MDQGFKWNPAFTLRVGIGEHKDLVGENLQFAIIGGALETKKGFTPQLKSTSISGADAATLTEEQLLLNVKAEHVTVKDDLSPESNKKLEWYGTVIINRDVRSILDGKFEGETQFGNPIAAFKFDADDKHNVHRIFVGHGRFVKKSENLCIEYDVWEACAKVSEETENGGKEESQRLMD